MYSEVIWTECQSGRAAADEYAQGVRRNIRNDKPILGPYGVNQEGSGDMYYKGAALIHMIRYIVGDSAFNAMLLELNKRFRHSITASAEVEHLIIELAHRDFQPMFDQYLRTTRIPVLEWGVRKGDLLTRWTNCVPGFNMLVNINVNGEERMVSVSDTWSVPAGGLSDDAVLTIDRNWYATDTKAGKRDLRNAGAERLDRLPSHKR